MASGKTLVGLVMVAMMITAPYVDAKKKKPKKKKTETVKLISESEFTKAVVQLAKDERMPVASSTLVEKGRSPDFYGVQMLLDDKPDTFWAEGVKGLGENQWVAFYLPEATTHVEIVPGAGREQFLNFNRPKLIFLDVYLARLKREGEEYQPKLKWLGRTPFQFKDEPKPVRQRISVKLPELVMSERVMYVGVLIIREVYKGQFDDTSISELRHSIIWGED